MAKVLKYPLTREEILGVKSGEIPYSVMKEKYGFHYTIYRNIKLGVMKGYEALLNEDTCEARPDTQEKRNVEPTKTEPRFVKKKGSERVNALLQNVKKVSFLNGDIYYIPRNGKIERFMYKKESGVSLEQALIDAGFLK